MTERVVAGCARSGRPSRAMISLCALGFACIWVALALFAIDGALRARRAGGTAPVAAKIPPGGEHPRMAVPLDSR